MENQEEPAHVARPQSREPAVGVLRRPVDKVNSESEHEVNARSNQFPNIDEVLISAVDQDTSIEIGLGEQLTIELAQKQGQDRMAQAQLSPSNSPVRSSAKFYCSAPLTVTQARSTRSPESVHANNHAVDIDMDLPQPDDDPWGSDNGVRWIIHAEDEPIENYANTNPGSMPPFPFDPTPEQCEHFIHFWNYWMNFTPSFRDFLTDVWNGPKIEITPVRGRSATTAAQTAEGVQAEAVARGARKL
ncbi:hypothetical protein N0V95_000592 [Ascochyta clinopodiicola]|nr:hypothetical protein N0V95_000592 [Ascochyta clinopodiicola]